MTCGWASLAFGPTAFVDVSVVIAVSCAVETVDAPVRAAVAVLSSRGMAAGSLTAASRGTDGCGPATVASLTAPGEGAAASPETAGDVAVNALAAGGCDVACTAFAAASVDGTMTGEAVVGAVTTAGVAIGGALASGVAAERIDVRS